METEIKLGYNKIITKPTPFVKWVGGKRNLLKEILPSFPKNYSSYYENFIGGGAVFFAIANKTKEAHISDSNFELIITYKAIQKDPKKLIELLRKHQRKHNEEYYYKIRSYETEDPLEIAARFVYLNKTCYNGLYRVNKQGKFNVPIGTYTKPSILQEDNIMACHRALKGVDICYSDFEDIQPDAGSFLYCDPPYHPTDDMSFTKYTKNDFTEKDQTRLRDYLRKLSKKGVYVMLSNSDTKFIRDLYKSKDFCINTVYAPRMVNCKPNQRGDVKELLITNYKVNIKCNLEGEQITLETN